MSGSQTGRYVPKDHIAITQVHGDLSQEVVKITIDRLKLILHLHVRAVESKRDWVAPAGILATLVATFATTSFKDWLLSAATWQAAFILSTVAVAIWLAVTVRRAMKSESVEDLVERIKKQPR